MSREHAFLRDCLRSFLRPEACLSGPSGLDRAAVNWEKLLNLAWAHSVEPAVYWVLHRQAEGAGLPPGIVQERWQARFRQIARTNLTLSAELARLLAVFQQAGVEVLALKGPVLAEALYGNLALRSFWDLDLLVRPGEVLRSKRVLESNGYVLASALHWPSDAACLRARESQLSFTNAHGVSVDVHWRLLPAYFPEVFESDRVWRQRREVFVAGARAWTLSPEHLFLFLCAHGAKHQWERLGWICDVARLLQVESGMDWTCVFAEARRTHTGRLVSLGLLLASELAGIALPPGAEQAAADPRARALAAWVGRRFRRDAPMPAPALVSVWFGFRAFERTRNRLRFAFEVLFGPSEADYRALRLPPALYGLYYVLRPFRLAAARLGARR